MPTGGDRLVQVALFSGFRETPDVAGSSGLGKMLEAPGLPWVQLASLKPLTTESALTASQGLGFEPGLVTRLATETPSGPPVALPGRGIGSATLLAPPPIAEITPLTVTLLPRDAAPGGVSAPVAEASIGAPGSGDIVTVATPPPNPPEVLGETSPEELVVASMPVMALPVEAPPVVTEAPQPAPSPIEQADAPQVPDEEPIAPTPPLVQTEAGSEAVAGVTDSVITMAPPDTVAGNDSVYTVVWNLGGAICACLASVSVDLLDYSAVTRKWLYSSDYLWNVSVSEDTLDNNGAASDQISGVAAAMTSGSIALTGGSLSVASAYQPTVGVIATHPDAIL